MTRAPGTPDGESPQPPKQTALLLFGDIADTTWRMFVPSILAILLGWWADSQFDTGPWLTLMGIIVGITVTSLLIKRMLKKLS